MEQERKRLVDGFATLERGTHEGLNASLLAPNQAARLINATVRGGFPRQRDPWRRMDLCFGTGEEEAWFEEHNIQGRYIYRPAIGYPVVIVSSGGRIFRIDVVRNFGVNVVELTDPADSNPAHRRHVWMEQAEQYLIIQDGQSVPLIYDGASLRRASLNAPTYEVPVGCMMAYGFGRLAVARPHRRGFVLGDIVNGGTEVVQFTETNFLAEGGDVTLPIDGEIAVMKVIAQLDRSTGHGDLMVMTPFGAVSARIGEKRDTWKDIQFQQVAMLGAGGVSQNSAVQVNGDLFFRAADGIRSLAMTRRDYQSSWAVTPLSREVNRTLSFDSANWLPFCDAALFDNRLLVLCNQAPVVNGAFHRGIIALDFDLISSMAEKAPPAYDGLWTGLNFTAIVAEEFPDGRRCFALHRNANERNELWELGVSGTQDNGVNPIEWVIESPALLRAGSTPFSLKKLVNGDLSLEDLIGDVTVQVQFKPDQSPCWLDWRTFSLCARIRECDTPTCSQPVHYRPQFRTKRRFGQPPDGCQQSDQKPQIYGFEFQTRVTITGAATLNAFRLIAIETEEDPSGGADADDDVAEVCPLSSVDGGTAEDCTTECVPCGIDGGTA